MLMAASGSSKKNAITTTEYKLRLQAWRLRQQLLCQRMMSRAKKEDASEDIELDTGNVQGR